MIGIVYFIVLTVLIAIAVEGLRWVLRPEAQRLRRIKKIGGSGERHG
jgi:hypothetical protein